MNWRALILTQICLTINNPMIRNLISVPDLVTGAPVQYIPQYYQFPYHVLQPWPYSNLTNENPGNPQFK